MSDSTVLAAIEQAAEGPPEPILSKPSTFTIWKPSQFLEWQAPEGCELLCNDLGDPILYDGSIAGIVGAPGVGKSRVALDIAIHQITGRQWCGLSLGDKPRRWLFLGNENSIRRWRTDLQAMLKNLDDDARSMVDAQLRIQAQTGDVKDLDMSIGPIWSETINHVQPDILVVDPFESTVGDGNNSGDVRAAITDMKSAVQSVKPDGSLLLVHHARTGRAATLGAVGFDGNNFAKGSKTFTSICRLQINVAAVDEDGAGVVIAIGKSNDGKPFKPFAAKLDDETMTYRRDECFSLSDWKSDVEGKRSGKSCSIRDVIECFNGKESMQRKDILSAMESATGASKRTCNTRIKEADEDGFITPSAARGEWMLSAKGRSYV